MWFVEVDNLILAMLPSAVCVVEVSVTIFHVRVSLRKTGSLQVLVSSNALHVCISELWVPYAKTKVFVPVSDKTRS
jgi:hypothetical protein